MKLKLRRLSAAWVTAALAAFTVLVNLAVFVPGLGFLQAILATGWLFILPGALALSLLGLPVQTWWEKLSLSVGFSVLTVILSALVTNTVLPWLGQPHPLEPANLMRTFNVIWLGLTAAWYYRHRSQTFTLKLPRRTRSATAVTIAGLFIVALAVFGAITLNNGGPNYLTLTMLVGSAVYLSLLIWRRDKLPENAIMTGIYCVGLALLLMMSLRGWWTTGHDVQREYRVFMLTLTNLHWSPAAYHDAYNACLSITLLPTVVKQVLGIDPTFVYKTIFQAIFALVPVITYLIARRFTKRHVALMAAIYFIAFPTYFQDMPMLNRQEIAFLFMSLAYLSIFNDAWSLRARRWLLLVFSLGVVVSHYSTTYTMLLIFLLVLGFRYGAPMLSGKLERLSERRQLAFAPIVHKQAATVTIAVIISLLGFSYVWSSLLTDTGGNVTRIAKATLQSIQHGLRDDTRSSDTSYSLFGQSKLTDQQRLENYDAKAVPDLRTDTTPDNLYPTTAASGEQIQVAAAETLPLTPLGQFLQRHGLNVTLFNGAIRQGSAFFLQIMLLAGLFVIFLGQRFRNLSNEYRFFQLASVTLIVAIIALPVLSAEYGLLRAFQQTLILSGASIVLATMNLIPRRHRRLRILLPSVFAIGMFLSSTGVFTSMLGGYPAQMHLANSGKYYDLFYPHATEAATAQWLNANEPHTLAGGNIVTTIETDRFFDGSHDLSTDLPRDNAYPNTIHRSAYVMLGYTATINHTASLYHNGDDITYIYPTDFLDANKDLIYSTSETRIYR